MTIEKAIQQTEEFGAKYLSVNGRFVPRVWIAVHAHLSGNPKADLGGTLYEDLKAHGFYDKPDSLELCNYLELRFGIQLNYNAFRKELKNQGINS